MTDEELNERFEHVEDKIRSESNVLILFIVWTLLFIGLICIAFALCYR